MAIKGGIPKTQKPTVSARDSEKAEFIESAPGKETYPWLDPRIRDDVLLQVNVKMPERLMAQIDWLAWQLNWPKRKVIETAMRNFVETEFRRRGIKRDLEEK